MAPIVRIILRYGAGLIFGMEAGDMLAGDPDIVELATVSIAAVAGVGTELWYWAANRYGWVK